MAIASNPAGRQFADSTRNRREPPALATVVEGQGDGLTAPGPLPEGEDDRDGEQTKEVRVLKDHGTAGLAA